MGQTRTAATSIADVIHKKKEAKKKVTGQLPTEQLVTGIGYHGKSVSQQDNSQLPPTSVKTRVNVAQVDEIIDNLISKEMINEKFSGWYAKCIYELGVSRFNRIVINSYNGRQPAKLLSYKLKGAMALAQQRNAQQAKLGIKGDW